MIKYFVCTVIFVLSCSAASATFAAPASQQQTASVAIEDLGNPVNIDAETVASRVLRSLLAQPLFTVDSQGKIRNLLIDAQRQDFKTNALSVRLRKGIHFSNGTPVRVNDVLFSIRRCLEARKDIPLNPTSHVSLLSEQVMDVWVDFPPAEGDSYSKLLTTISECPILSRQNVVLFGRDFGVGSNYIAAGEFLISNFKGASGYSLTRTDIFSEKIGVKDLEIVNSEESRKSLTMLRAGGLDALITSDPETIATAKQDSTLQVVQCFEKTLIKRAKFTFFCTNEFELSDVGYAA